MTKEWIDLAIENWARWHQRKLFLVRCKSVERLYRSPQRRHWPNDAPPFEIRTVNPLAAQEVESAWKTLPFKPKMVLKWWFIFKRSAGKICKALRQKRWPVIERDFDLELEVAKLLLGQALAKQKAQVHNPSSVVVCAQGAHVGGHPSPRQNQAA